MIKERVWRQASTRCERDKTDRERVGGERETASQQDVDKDTVALGRIAAAAAAAAVCVCVCVCLCVEKRE